MAPMSKKEIFWNFVFSFFLLNIDLSAASCFGKDAHFKKTDQPVVSQPSKSDPTQVLVSWDKIIQRPECVDKYQVYVWPQGSDINLAEKISVTEKSGKNVVTKKLVKVEPCINYKFMVALEEVDSVTGLNYETTAEQVYKTSATVKVPAMDKTQFKVSYHWDASRGHVDLQKADIEFESSLITYPSCLDEIQVTGTGVTVTTGPPLTRSRSVSPTRGQSLQYLTGSTNFNPSLTANTASTLPAKISYSDIARGTSVSSSSSSITSTSTSSFPTPQFAYSMQRAQGSSKKKLGPIRFYPPYLNKTITMTVPVEDCAQYNFDVKFVAGGKEAGKVSGVLLPALADQPGFVPPPVTSVLTISFSMAGKPIYGVKTSSGVNAACLPAYFEAYDAYTQRLENEVGWQAEKTGKIQQLVSSSQSDLTKSQEELLKSMGCQCSSPKVNLTTTDQNILKKSEASQLGQYLFQGIFNEKPYFMKKGLVEKDTMYLYHDTGHKQWRFTNDLGGKKELFFATEEKSAAKCPADVGTEGHWQAATGTFGRFKKNANVKVVCIRG